MPIRALNTIPKNVRELPVCAVDLGFATKDSTVGLVFDPNAHAEQSEYTFGDAVRQVELWLKGLSEKVCVLVIEAPLSMAMTAKGNPCHRTVELSRYYVKNHAPVSPKGWFYQAGANLCLSSTVFLKQLSCPSGVEVLLIEGFYCSLNNKEARTSHKEVAKHLLDQVRQHPGQSLVQPLAEGSGGEVRLLPGLERSITGIPYLLLRAGLQLKTDRMS